MNTELMKDDEALRENAFATQEVKIGNLAVRPMTAGTFMQCRRAGIFDTEDNLFWISGYLYIHAADKAEVALAVQDRAKFEAAMYAFIEANFKHHGDLVDFSESIDGALRAYSASRSKPLYPSPEGATAGNA